MRPEAIDLHGGTKKLGVSTSSSNYDKHLPLMIDMMILAFQTDLTRVITLPFADEESNQVYPWADAPVPHHGTSHHMGDPAKIAVLAKINLYHMKHVAYLLQKLDSIKEGNGSVPGQLADRLRQRQQRRAAARHDNLPTLLFGEGGGTVRTGRRIQARFETRRSTTCGCRSGTCPHRGRARGQHGKLSLT